METLYICGQMNVILNGKTLYIIILHHMTPIYICH